MSNSIKVSFVSGVYNAKAYLGQCIDSMLSQNYDNYEIVLVVNASIDGSEGIVREYADRYPEIIKAYYMENKLGAGGSREFGVNHSDGEYICFVDCDDIVSDNYISSMMIQAEKDSWPDIVTCNFKKIDKDEKDIYIRQFADPESARVQSVAPWAKMFKRQFLEERAIHLRNVPFGEDVILSAELYLAKPRISIVDNIGYVWRDNPISTSHTELGGFPKNTFEISSEYFDYMKGKYPEETKILNYFVLKYYVWYLLQSGRGVSKSMMRAEYDKLFGYMNASHSDWNKFGKYQATIRGERFIVSAVLLGVRVMCKFKLAKSFFAFYAQSGLGRFWPSL